jgi:mRNA interferase MazF
MRKTGSVRRGEIWWASLPSPTGSGPGFRRPVLVVSADSYNRSGIRTVIAAVVTSNLQLAEAPGNVRVGKRESGLPKPSVVNVSQILTLDKSRLEEKVKAIPRSVLRDVDSGLLRVLQLEASGA